MIKKCLTITINGVYFSDPITLQTYNDKILYYCQSYPSKCRLILYIKIVAPINRNERIIYYILSAYTPNVLQNIYALDLVIFGIYAYMYRAQNIYKTKP